MPPFFRLLCWSAIFLLTGASGFADCLPLSFWVWNRNTPLTGKEHHLLREGKVSSLYWQCGTLMQTPNGWAWRNVPLRPGAFSDSLEIIPVLRLEFSSGNPFSPASADSLISLLNPWMADQHLKKVQFDCDCPTRYLPDYAAWCRRVKKENPSLRVEITALASWANQAAELFPGCVDEISPMFYDLNPEREQLREGIPSPILDEASTRKNLLLWKKCPLPWRAGLPYFTRTTLFDSSGTSRGHLRNVSPEDVIYNPSLLPGKTSNGNVIMSASKKGWIGKTPFQPGDSISLRFTNLDSLKKMEAEALAQGPAGIIYFRLPDEGKTAIQSLPPLFEESSRASVRLERSSDGAYVLVNSGSTDLLPAVQAPNTRGYELVLQSSSPIWREVMPGDFHTLYFSSTSDPLSRGIAPPLANQLHLYFSHLPAGAQLSTGWIRYAAGQNRADVQYQLITPEHTGPWLKLP